MHDAAGRRRVAVFHAAGCSLCDRALKTVRPLRDELGFELEEIDISGDPELERDYREFIPVVEIDGRRAFVLFVPAEALRRKLAAQSPG